MSTDKDILEEFFQKLENKLRERLPRATGKTVDSLEHKVQNDGGQLLAASWIGALEYGRGPRKSSQDQGMWRHIQEWLAVKGMDASESNAKRLTWWINMHGTSLFQSGKPSEVISGVINEQAIDNLSSKLGDYYAVSFVSEVLKDLKILKVI